MTEFEDNISMMKLLEDYSSRKGYVYTPAAIKAYTDYKDSIDDQSLADTYLNRCLNIAKMIVNLHVKLSSLEKDMALAATLLHSLYKHTKFDDFRAAMASYGIGPEVCEIVEIITINDINSDDERILFYDRIRGNKIALVVRLFERSNLVERLHIESIAKSKYQIAETKKYFFPMCIFAKEKYPELAPSISIIMEKMRSLIFVSEILMARFERKEKELNDQILFLKEENSRIRGMINQLVD